MRLRSPLFAASVFATACIVPDLDLEGKACPCLDGWVCDPMTDTCRRPMEGDDSGSTSTSGDASTSTKASAGTAASTGTPSPLFDVIAFSGDWSTPASIHWTWEVTGEEADFHAYEVRVAETEEGLETGEGRMVFDGAVNPELDRFLLRNTMSVDRVVGTITSGLEAGREYFARLYVYDTAGGVTKSPNVAVRSTTMVPTEELVVFADANPIPPGTRYPPCMEHVDSDPAEGSTQHWELVLYCESTMTEDGDPVSVASCDPSHQAPECWENLRLQGLELPAVNIGGGDFADAFLEAYIRIDPPADIVAHGWWSEVGVNIGGGDGRLINGVTLRADGRYHLYQFPLTQLQLSADTFDGVIEGFRVGSMWPVGTRILFDEVRIRW